MHPDKDKRMTNPTIGTLIKIVDFFKADGIPVSIDDFVGTRKTIVNVQEQALEPLTHTKTVPVCNWYGGQEQSDIRINVCENEQNINLIAFIAEEDFKPIFKKGSVFIVNKDVRPENDNIVGIKLEVDGKILIKKLHKNNNRLFVSRFENDLEEIELSPEQYYDIIGVVVQIIAKT
ncbi:S24 family peptidase [Legionella sp. CNM-4043-24]|uniref:S24 family peptidase n=1 Tax=Legionella sp. CNM-4043-24 TaxID=3421646 RepID=UPI00403AE957